MYIGTKVAWISYGVALEGIIEAISKTTLTVRLLNGPMAGKLRIILADGVKVV